MSDKWIEVLGEGAGKKAYRSAPLAPGGNPYWHAAARIDSADGGGIRDAAIALQGPVGPPRRLHEVENALLAGTLADADGVMDAVRDLVQCEDDAEGSAAAKSYIAGWVCADVVGRCIK